MAINFVAKFAKLADPIFIRHSGVRDHPSAILDLFAAFLDHPRSTFGGMENLVGIHTVVLII